LDPGTVAVTSAGSLNAKYIFHVVTPIWTGGEQGEEEKLSSGVYNVLVKADELKVRSIAIPNLSGGMFGFPTDRGTEILVNTIVDYLNLFGANSSLKTIRFVNLNYSTVKWLKLELEKRVANQKEQKKETTPINTEGRNINETQLLTQDESTKLLPNGESSVNNTVSETTIQHSEV